MTFVWEVNIVTGEITLDDICMASNCSDMRTNITCHLYVNCITFVWYFTIVTGELILGDIRMVSNYSDRRTNIR